MWGILPAAGRGTRLQPLAFSKELLPIAARPHGAAQRPCAVSEYLLQRLILGGVDKICLVVAPGKSDIIEYHGGAYRTESGRAAIVYAVQPRPVGLCDAVFCAHPVIPPNAEAVIIGLPDTVWFPEDALRALPDGILSLLLFPVAQPASFDAVLLDEQEEVREVRVKSSDPGSRWIWGAIKLPGSVFHELRSLWYARGCADEYLGTLINAYLGAGGRARGVRTGQTYLDVGSLHGYRAAIELLGSSEIPPPLAATSRATEGP